MEKNSNICERPNDEQNTPKTRIIIVRSGENNRKLVKQGESTTLHTDMMGCRDANSSGLVRRPYRLAT
jgi:hypothetical protein